MPKFVLSGPQIDTIITYINSLSVTKAPAPKAKTPVQITDAMDIGDARKGLNYAREVCAACHNVQPSDAASPNSKAPPFKRITNAPGMSVTALTVWSRTTHPTMPNLIIEPNDMDDLICLHPEH
jgi:mono/diheme cytochrome c family protein